MEDIKKNIEGVRAKISEAAAAAGRDGDEVILVAVSKTRDPEEINTAIDAGMTVEFTVSAGAGITIPDYSRYGREEADSANADILVSKKSAYSTAVAYGDLISQSKQAGEKVLASDNRDRKSVV